VTRQSLAKYYGENGIIANSSSLAKRLSTFPGAPGFSVRQIVFEGEHHNSVVPPMITRAVLLGLEP
jgi:hypothetical protein